MSTSKVVSRRGMFRQLLRETVDVVLEARSTFKKAANGLDLFASSDTSYPLTLYYPRELFEEEALRHGIDIDKVGIEEAVRRLVTKNGRK